MLHSSTTKELILKNLMLRLSVFNTIHPPNETEWKRMRPDNNPLAHLLYSPKLVKLLKSVTPHQGNIHEMGMAESFSRVSSRSGNFTGTFPMDSDQAMVVSYFKLAFCIVPDDRRPKTGV